MHVAEQSALTTYCALSIFGPVAVTPAVRIGHLQAAHESPATIVVVVVDEVVVVISVVVVVGVVVVVVPPGIVVVVVPDARQAPFKQPYTHVSTSFQFNEQSEF